MAPKRQPTPSGSGGATESVKDGTSVLQPSPTPGFVGAAVHHPPPAPVLLCEKGHTVFTPTWHSGDGDTSYEDPLSYHSLTPDAQARVDPYLNTSDEDLKQIFRDFVTGSLSTGELGGAMVDRFFDGSQAEMRHAKGSTLSEKAKNTSSFRSHAASVRDRIGALLPRPAGPGLTNYQFLTRKIDVPTVNFEITVPALAALATRHSGDELTLKALIGGTQGLKITLQNISFYKNHSPNYTQFAVELRYEIFDNFGAGGDDIYTQWWKRARDYRDALVAFWVLQHMRHGHRPFVNWIEIETTVLGGRL